MAVALQTITDDNSGTQYYVDINSLLYVTKGATYYELYFGSGTNQLKVELLPATYKTWMKDNAGLNPVTLS